MLGGCIFNFFNFFKADGSGAGPAQAFPYLCSEKPEPVLRRFLASW